MIRMPRHAMKLQPHPPDAWHRGIIADDAQDGFDVPSLAGRLCLRGHVRAHDAALPCAAALWLSLSEQTVADN